MYHFLGLGPELYKNKGSKLSNKCACIHFLSVLTEYKQLLQVPALISQQ